jgi:hypothetical protein
MAFFMNCDNVIPRFSAAADIALYVGSGIAIKRKP